MADRWSAFHRARVFFGARINKTAGRLGLHVGLKREFPFLSLSRRYLVVRLDVTDRCNLRCKMCNRNIPGPPKTLLPDMPLELFQKIAAGTFPFTRALFLSFGAEPLMAKAFPDFLDIIGGYRVPEVTIITNGTLLDRPIIERLIRGGVTSVYVSVDAADPRTFESIRRGARFEKVIENLRLVRQIKEEHSFETPAVRFSVTLMRSNIEQLPQIMNLAKDLDVKSVHASHMVLYKELDLQEESLVRYKALTNRYLEETRALAEKIKIPFCGPKNFEDAGSVIPSSDDAERECNSPWAELLVASDGKVLPCCYWYEASRMGDFNTQTFKEIWHGKEYRRLRQELKTNSLRKTCSNCPMKKDSGASADDAFTEKGDAP